jgi:hypothetical protein
VWPPGSGHPAHDHADASIAGVFYAQVPEARERRDRGEAAGEGVYSAALALSTAPPTCKRPETGPTKVEVTEYAALGPEAGTIVMFPGIGVIDNKLSTDVEYSPPPPRVCMIIHPEGTCKSCSDVGRVPVINNPPGHSP